MKRKILFVSHQASRTGAPFMLLYFMEWLKENHSSDFEIGILHLQGGELKERFNATASNHFTVSKVKHKSLAFKVINKLSRGYLAKTGKSNLQKLIDQIVSHRYDVIYGNTAAVLPIAIEIKKNSLIPAKLFAHIHEMQASLKTYVRNPSEVVPYLDHTIAASGAVKSSILSQWGISNQSVSVVYEFSKVDIADREKQNEGNKFTVGGSGNYTARKGPDLFVQVARFIHQNFEDADIEFVWVGKITDKQRITLEEDLEKLELLDRVRFVGLQSDPHKFYNQLDVFLMTSREDPFPLVCIEVGMLGKPIICFDKATGTQEVLENGGGEIVPYLNIEKMADAVWAYHENRDKLAKDSEIVKNIFNGFTPEQKCPELYELIIKI